ncbi:MAG TPA: putative manganese-dependent inorganic diphosphatase, partial [Candidatus Binatia bacterium]|nr:putative manganese-dependent inorganic diphosphatase [Candidatus Binatia bacterium]
AETLEADVIVGDPSAEVRGDVLIGAMSPESMVEYISPGDLIIVGNRENAQHAALSRDICCLIITGGFVPSARIQELARKRNTAILVTPHDTFAAARLINLSVSALMLMDRNPLTARPDTLIQEVVQDLLESRMGILLVVDAAGKLLGIVTKSDLVGRRARPVILVDHSEESQSVEGIREAEILEILDHHRLGGLETAKPILALIAPVGCTATLVLRRYREMDVGPPRAIAGIMLAAILSDTMLLKSPTTTDEDRRAVEYLAPLWGEDPMDFGVRMYNAKFDMASQSAEEVITADVKSFDFAAGDIAVAQVEVGDKSVVLRRKAELLQAMRDYCDGHNLVLAVLLVTDIKREGSELLAVGRTRAVERAFDCKLQDGSVYLPGVLSRKKQVVPPIAQHL